MHPIALKFLALAGIVFQLVAVGEELKLYRPAVTPPFWPGYSINVNAASTFAVNQNDPALSDFFTSARSQVTDLCIPATTANYLLNQFSLLKDPNRLPIPGVITNTPVDGAQVVRSLIEKCDLHPRTATNREGGIDWFQMGKCLKQTLQNAGDLSYQLHYIRKNQGDSEGLNYEDRAPTLADISTALASGNQVIAIITSLNGTHAINVYGYSANETDANSLVIYLQNSNRLYNMNFKDAVFDTALLTNHQGSIELTTLQGRLLNFPGKTTSLVGVLILPNFKDTL